MGEYVEEYAVSSAQKRMYMLQQLHPRETAYNMPLVLTAEGKLDQERLQQAFQKLIKRHESLRTRFVIVDGEPVQQIEEDVSFTVCSANGTEEEAGQWVQSFVQPFDLSAAPLLRVGVMRLSEETHLLAIDMHHIICDGVAISILVNEFNELYHGAELPPLRIQYKDFAVWQNERRKSEAYKKQEEYWLKQLSGELPVLQLPTDRKRPAAQSFIGGAVESSVSPELAHKLKQLAGESGATLFMVLLAAYQTLLARYSGQEDIIVGSPIAGRPHADLEKIVGMFVNTLALRGYPQREKTFRAFLEEMKETALQAYEHQEVPFEALVERLGAPRDVNRNPLFDAMFVLQNTESAELAMDGLTLRPYQQKHRIAKFDLTLQAEEKNGELQLTWEYRTELFERETIERWTTHWLQLLEQVADDPDIRLGEIDLLTKTEKHRLLHTFNGTKAAAPNDRTVHQLFEEQAERTPEKTAVVCGAARLTYRELNNRANHLAYMLRENGVKPDTTVALMADRSPLVIVSILGILKAGGAYVPIDPSHPEERIQFVIKDSKADILITQKQLTIDVMDSKRILNLQQINWEGLGDPDHLPPSASPDNLAYVIYTSGTTGKPKGVMVEHRSVAHNLLWHADEYRLTSENTFLQLGAYTFDASILSTFSPLLTGATVAMAGEDQARDPNAVSTIIASDNVTHLCCPPSFYTLLLDALTPEAAASLRTVIMGGERLPEHMVYRSKRNFPFIELVNEYGPTESCVTSSVQRDVCPDENITIGRPIRGTRMYIVNEACSLQPIGAPGELCISGKGLARGYVNQPELSAEKFVANPYAPGERMYRTGDLARWLPDGSIEFLGRIDHQVKIRGYRIEPGEIEQTLLAYEAIKEAAVIAKEEADGDKTLCAYYVACLPVNPGDLRAHTTAALPFYMVPSFFIELDRMPVTPNGKLDEKALPEPDRLSAAAEYVEPATQAERDLALIWQEVLGVERVGAADHFFKLGGHSLKAMLLVSRIHRELGAEVPVRDVFQHPTVRQLALRIEADGEVSAYKEIEPVPLQQEYPVSPAQKRMYMLHHMHPETTAYHIPTVMVVEGAFNLQRLEQAIHALIRRHESLRTRFVLKEGVPMQIVEEDVPFSLPHTCGTEADAERWVDSIVQPFDLSAAPLFRAGVMSISNERHLLVIDMHHIIADGMTMSIFINEFNALYQGFELKPLRIQYKDFAVWQNSRIQKKAYRAKEAYWLAQLAGELPYLKLPGDKPRPSVQDFRGGVVESTADAELKRKLERLAEQNGATLYMVLLAAYQTLLSRYSGQDDIIVGSPIAGRPHPDLEKIAGMFVNTLALRGYPKEEKTFQAFLTDIKKTTLEAFDHQEVPFEALVEKLEVRRDINRNPVFDVMFSFQNIEQHELKMDGLKLRQCDRKHTTAKFDLTMRVKEQSGRLLFALEYSTALFKQETVERWAGHWQQLLEQVAADPDIRLGEIDILTEKERHQLLHTFNEEKSGEPTNKTIHQLFEEQVYHRPSQTAVICEDQSITYRELNDRANRLARLLRKKGVRPDDIVGLAVERSVEMIIGIIGILKAGGAYLPLDLNSPEERTGFILEDSHAKFLLRRQNGQNIPFAGETVLLDEIESLPAESNLPAVSSPQHLAYAIYTSGSTGKPKGVLIEQSNVVNLVDGLYQRIYRHYAESLKIALIAPVYFDASVKQIFASLLLGHTLVIAPEAARFDHRLLTGFYHRQNIDISDGTPAHLQLLAGAKRPVHVKHFIIGGEALPADLVERIWEMYGGGPKPVITNIYGPAECTVDAVSYHVEPGNHRTIPIGKPLPNDQVYIMNRYNKLQPVGVAGELCIGGAGLARGYLNRPELTREKFAAHPFTPGARMYKTGDLARWLPDGNIEYIGRTDHQINLRGFRIEPGEIENRLLEHPAVKEAAVIMREDTGGDKALCAYYVTEQPTEAKQLRSHLEVALPPYMVPAFFISLEQMPLTANGKLDRHALPKPDGAVSAAEHVPPDTAAEAQLARLWQEVLGIGRIGVEDHFFELGGHSLKAMTLIWRIKQEMNLDVPLQAVFQYPRIRDFAGFIASSKQLSFDQLKGHMVQLSKKGDGNLYCFPGIGGAGYIFRTLCEHLPGWNGFGMNYIESPNRIGEYVEQIKRIQPHGPYYFLAYSAGSALAYEVIKQLESNNDRVERLILFDCRMENSKEKLDQQKVEKHAEEFVEQFIIEQFVKKNNIQDHAHITYLRNQGRKSVLSFYQYRQEMVYEAPINAEIHRIEAEHEKWDNQDIANMTIQKPFSYQGYGAHQEMLNSPFAEKNAEILLGILNKVKSL
ncbi:amino acid adenylation domain-containing protein [Bacillus sonorensis]|uniref:non-ribosomal peptide synthetase n=1 Tax=Bacillus sonorensis TaxID=119858 RepID=UPI002280673C|nr:non-ribosomal peptide synthetase [Bacillus sonorensis]MCY7858962.1 amino acid adenylation domain-containing protein [Bacillus sonorensis]